MLQDFRAAAIVQLLNFSAIIQFVLVMIFFVTVTMIVAMVQMNLNQYVKTFNVTSIENFSAITKNVFLYGKRATDKMIAEMVVMKIIIHYAVNGLNPVITIIIFVQMSDVSRWTKFVIM